MLSVSMMVVPILRVNAHTNTLNRRGFLKCWLSQDGRLECSLFLLKGEKKSWQFFFVLIPICCASQISPAEGGASQYLLCPLVWFGSGKISFQSAHTFIYWWYSHTMVSKCPCGWCHINLIQYFFNVILVKLTSVVFCYRSKSSSDWTPCEKRS